MKVGELGVVGVERLVVARAGRGEGQPVGVVGGGVEHLEGG